MKPASATSAAKALSAGGSIRWPRAASSQPSHLASSAPVQRRASLAHSRRVPALCAGLLGQGGHRLDQLFGQGHVLAVEPVAQDGGALSGHRGVERVGCVGELAHPLDHQAVCDRVQVKAEMLGLVQHAGGRIDVLGQARAHRPVVAEGVHGLGRHGVDRAWSDQGFDVEHVGIVGVLGPGGGPEQPLGRRAGRRQRHPSRSGDQRLIALVGDLGASDGDLATHRSELRGVDPLAR